MEIDRLRASVICLFFCYLANYRNMNDVFKALSDPIWYSYKIWKQDPEKRTEA